MAQLMAHLVAGFPDWEISLQFGRGLADAGSSYLEVQFPFSDGTADGPRIQAACDVALAGGFTVARGFDLVSQLTTEVSVPVAVMTYANLIFQNGVGNFVARCRDAGATAIIAPDLPPDYDEGLYREARSHSIEVIPVVAPTITPDRLRLVLASATADLVYVALREGITGKYTELGEATMRFLATVRSGGARIAAGFGIRSPEQVEMLAAVVDYVVVGSLFVEALQAGLVAGRSAEARQIAANTVQALIGT
jgi:tryptophan synthase alpha chain